MTTPATDLAFADGRRAYLGGTDIARLLGLAPEQYGGPHHVYLSKVEGLDTADNPAMARGRYLEPAVAQHFANETLQRLSKVEHLRHPEFPFLGGNPDFLFVDDPDCLLEVKTANARMRWAVDDEGIEQWGPDGASGPDAVRLDYFAQCQWYMGLTGRRRAKLRVAFVDDDVVARCIAAGVPPEFALAAAVVEYRTYHLEFDPDMWFLAVNTGREWWEKHVAPRIPPPLDLPCSDAVMAYLVRKAQEGARDIVAPPDLVDVVLNLARAMAEAKAIEKKKDSLRATVAAFLAEEGGKKLSGVYLGKKWSLQIIGGGKAKEKLDYILLAADFRNRLLALGESEDAIAPIVAAHTVSSVSEPHLHPYLTSLSSALGLGEDEGESPSTTALSA